MNERDLSNYQTILERCDDVLTKLECIGYSNEIWKRNHMVRDSILFSLSQIGELVSHFKTNEYEELFPEIPWRRVESQRAYISYRYEETGFVSAWKSAIVDVPAIRKALLSNEEIAHNYDIECESAEYESGSWEGTLTSLRVGRPEESEAMEGFEKDAEKMIDTKDGKAAH